MLHCTLVTLHVSISLQSCDCIIVNTTEIYEMKAETFTESLLMWTDAVHSPLCYKDNASPM